MTITTVDPVTINDDPIAANIEALMETALIDSHVKVAVRRVDGGKSKVYVAVLAVAFAVSVGAARVPYLRTIF